MAEQSIRFVTLDGQAGTVELPAGASLPDSGQVRLRLENGARFLVPADLLQPQSAGEYLLPIRLGEAAVAATADFADAGTLLVLPVIQEDLVVERRPVETGRVKVTKQVSEHQEVVDEPGYVEHVEVERVPINQPVETAPAARYEGDTLIIPVMEEVLVVEKRLLLREEIRIHKQREEVHNPQQVTLRKEEVTVERNGENKR